MAHQPKGVKFVLTEDGGSVRAFLAIDGARILDFENEQSPKVNIRHPKIGEKELIKMAEYWSHRDRSLKGNPKAVLDAYIGSREGDVAKEVLIIRKALRKIAGSMRNAVMAKTVKKGLRK